jgi:hypothetical protein
MGKIWQLGCVLAVATTTCGGSDEACAQLCECINAKGCESYCEELVASSNDDRASCLNDSTVQASGCEGLCQNFSTSIGGEGEGEAEGEDLVDPETDPDGVLQNLTIAGGTYVAGPPPASSGTDTTVSGGGGSVAVTAGQTTTVNVSYSTLSGYAGCVVTVEGATGYIDVPNSTLPAAGTVPLVITVGADIGTGAWTCVYGVYDISGGVSNYVDTEVSTTNKGTTPGGFDCGDGSSISADIACNGTPDCAGGQDEGDMCYDPTSCCQATQGCPGETGSSCGGTCCCCGAGEACCADWSGCCPSA